MLAMIANLCYTKRASCSYAQTGFLWKFKPHTLLFCKQKEHIFQTCFRLKNKGNGLKGKQNPN